MAKFANILLLGAALLSVFAGRGAIAAAPTAVTKSSVIPSLDAMSGYWMQTSTLRSLPALNSALGSGQATSNVLAVTNLSFPPLTMSGDTGSLTINNAPIDAQECRWYPYQVDRRAQVQGLRLETQVRMPYTRRGLLFEIDLSNQSMVPLTVKLGIRLSSLFAPHTSWGWNVPRDPIPGEISAAAMDGKSLEMHNPPGTAWSVFRFTQKPDILNVAKDGNQAQWSITLQAGQTREIDYVLAVGIAQPAVTQQAQQQAQTFDASFAQVKTDWQTRFHAMFQPHNRFFSGSLPALVTSDPNLRQVYYMSALSLLSVCRTCFPLAPRVYVSNSPEDNCTMVYFWDTREWATVLALLDPAMMKRYLVGWLQKGIYNGYAEEFLTGSLQGPWYSANDMSVFIQLDTYVNVTGDRAFLSQVISGQTVLQHMDAIAMNWKRLVKPGHTLADYGGAWNLLEAVPTYTHEVASFNAANVWMMRRAAQLEASTGHASQSAALRHSAQGLLPAVLALYQPGQGVWAAEQPNGSQVPVRTVVDFVTVSQMITGDLTPAMRLEMVQFVQRELLTDHWMRALSLSDAAASQSDRPDHGPNGAFSAWPAETVAAFCVLDRYPLALKFLDSIAAVTDEGPFSQSREILGTLPDSPVRIASRGDQTYNVSTGAAFMNSIIQNMFGYQPDVLTGALLDNERPRGFGGELLNVRNGNHLYNIISGATGLRSEPVKQRKKSN
jgi:hypothetical protein